MKTAQRKSSSIAKAKFVSPMKALLVEEPRPGDWLYEIKFDGYRALAVKNGDSVQLMSRNKNEMGEKFPSIVKAVAKLKAHSAVLDGELVIVGEDGKTSFQELQAFHLRGASGTLAFFVFDILHLDGVDLRSEPLTVRRSTLQKLIRTKSSPLKFSAALEGDYAVLIAAARKAGLEGLIAKRVDSTYETGKRTGSWIKLKISNEQEFVIGGYTEPRGSRQSFGALLVGYYEKGKFRFAGKVGTGFNEALLTKLHKQFQKLVQLDCPFPDLPEKKAGRYGSGITKSVMKECTWLKPTTVCQLKFTEWTSDGKLRHPVFLGLREDKAAKQVRRETAKRKGKK